MAMGEDRGGAATIAPRAASPTLTASRAWSPLPASEVPAPPLPNLGSAARHGVGYGASHGQGLFVHRRKGRLLDHVRDKTRRQDRGDSTGSEADRRRLDWQSREN